MSGIKINVQNKFTTDCMKYLPKLQIRHYNLEPIKCDVAHFINPWFTVPTKIRTFGVNTSPKVVSEGSLTLTCTVTGVPLPEIVWLKNGEQLTEGDIPNISIKNQGIELVISDAEVKMMRFTVLCYLPFRKTLSGITKSVPLYVCPSHFHFLTYWQATHVFLRRILL